MSYQYQEIASPPPQEQAAVVPDFFAAYAPDSFPPRYPQHTTATVPPGFETLPAPTEGYAYYPDRLYPYPLQHTTATSPPQFQTLPYVWGANAFYPDRLERIKAPVEYPFKPQGRIDPPPLDHISWKGVYPDRLDWPRRLWPYPHVSAQNLDPIADPFIPDYFKANYPTYRLEPYKPAPFPFRFYTPTPSTFRVLDDYSRGLYVGDIRGLYHTKESASVEPYASFNTVNGQTITSGAYTQLTAFATGGHAGFTGNDMNAWGMVDLVNSRITFKHDGYYVVAVTGEWENNSTGQRRLRVRLFTDAGVAQRVVMEDIRSAQFTAGIAIASDLQPIARSWYITAEVFQNSGGDLITGSFFISVYRLSRPRTVLPV